MLRILQLTKKIPYPLKDGESIAVKHIAKGLSEFDCQMDLLSFNTIKHFQELDLVKSKLNYYNEIHAVFLDNRVKIIDAFFNLFSSDSYNVSRFRTKEYKNELIKILKSNSYDVVIVESLFMCPYIDVIRLYSQARIVMRSHNLEFQIWERLAINEKNILKKWYLKLLVKRLKRYELLMLDNYDLLVPISVVDERYYRSMKEDINILSIPTGLDVNYYPKCISEINKPVRFFFLGSLDWAPNIEGLNWFIENVWKLESNKGELYVAGRNCPDWLSDLDVKNVVVVGEVEDAHEFISKNDIMIVPLFSGSGIRIKILESMAIGKPVITTNVGREGIEAKNMKELLIANSAKEFSEQMDYVLQNEKEVLDIAKSAHTFVYEKFDHLSLIKSLYNELENLFYK